MSIETAPFYFDECPCLHKMQFPGFQSPMHKNIYNICTSLSAIAHSFLPFPKVTAMSDAFVSKDVYEVYAMVERVADYLGIGMQQLTRNLSPDSFCLVLKETDLRAHTDQTLAARGSLNGLPFEL